MSSSTDASATEPHPPQRSDALHTFAVMAGLGAIESVETPKVAFGANLNVVAMHLGQIAARLDLFMHNGMVVALDSDGERAPMTGIWFRTWINDHVIIYEKRNKDTDAPVPMTLATEAANTILANSHFRRSVRLLNGLNRVRQPVIRRCGALELLPFGYDEETGIFTVDTGIHYNTNMDLEAAKGWLDRIYRGLPISDERSFAVIVGGLLALYVACLPGGSGLRPGFIVRGNKPGCGKSVIAKSWQYPTLGRCPSVKLKEGEQLDKEIEAFMIAGVPCLFLDNVYGKLRSATLDQILSNEESEGRAMGGHGLFRARNSALLMVTANSLEGNDDADRRFLLADLFEPGDPKERKIPRDLLLSDPVMKRPEWRSRMLAICYALVRNWYAAGIPDGAITRPTFEGFSWLLGGIMEAAGYVNPFVQPAVEVSLNPKRGELASLLKGVLDEMRGEGVETKQFMLSDLCRIARARGVFEHEVGTRELGRKLAIKEDRITGEASQYVEDRGCFERGQDGSFGKALSRLIKEGETPSVDGLKLEFGKRYQSQKSAWMVTIVG